MASPWGEGADEASAHAADPADLLTTSSQWPWEGALLSPLPVYTEGN